MKDRDPIAVVRRDVVALLEGRGAHEPFDEVLRDFPAALRGVRPLGFTHTAWRLLEHLRIAQKDILEFSRDEAWESPGFPDGYWPAGDAPPTATAWDETVVAFRADLAAMRDLVSQDPLAMIPWTDGTTILHEALLVADHNAYHLGQIVDLRRALGIWPPPG
jgi:hypothetical protein